MLLLVAGLDRRIELNIIRSLKTTPDKKKKITHPNLPVMPWSRRNNTLKTHESALMMS